jgi:UPF0042 nucleotide-binding protein
MAHNHPIIVTGLSGAGMSSALKVLEDMGYEVFDNFPLPLIDELITKSPEGGKPIALGIDTRSRGFDTNIIIEKVQQYNARLLFITADETVLQKRFTETRRVHPLAADRPVSAGIKKELALLYPLREIADPLIDTTELSIHDLKRVLRGYFAGNAEGRLNITLMSFGFKNGLPREADIVMDVRFLKNPHWEPDLKPLSGQDKPVQDYVAGDAAFAPFLDNLKNLLEPLFERYRHEGKNYLTVAIGCTGGKHRSVFVVETLQSWLQQKGLNPSAEHRDLYRY